MLLCVFKEIIYRIGCTLKVKKRKILISLFTSIKAKVNFVEYI